MRSPWVWSGAFLTRRPSDQSLRSSSKAKKRKRYPNKSRHFEIGLLNTVAFEAKRTRRVAGIPLVWKLGATFKPRMGLWLLFLRTEVLEKNLPTAGLANSPICPLQLWRADIQIDSVEGSSCRFASSTCGTAHSFRSEGAGRAVRCYVKSQPIIDAIKCSLKHGTRLRKRIPKV